MNEIVNPKLNGDYNRGYAKALIDVQNFLESHSEAMKYNKLYSHKGISAVLSALIQNREELRETGTVDDLIAKKDKKNIIVCKAKTNNLSYNLVSNLT
jgi:hypothetical protein